MTVHQPTRRQFLTAVAGTAGLLAVSPQLFGRDEPATMPTTAPTTAGTTAPTIALANKRFKVCADDEFLDGHRQSVKAFAIAKKSGLDGVSVDMGRMPAGKEFTNQLRDEKFRQAFIDETHKTGVAIASLSFFAMYAHVVPTVPNMAGVLHDWVDLMVKMDVKLGYMPFMTKDGTLREPEHAAVWQQCVDLFKEIGPVAEKAGVVLGVESNIDADGYKKFLDAVGSPAVQAFYNPGVGLENKFDVYGDIRALGKSRVCALHLEQGSVPPEKFEHRFGDGLIDFRKLRDVLMEIEWGGWMSIARSRLKGTTSAVPNMTANAKFVHELFPE